MGMAAVFLALVATACSSGTAARGAGGPTAPSAADTRFAQPGPYAAGTARVVMANGDQLQLWYPVDKSAVQGLVPYTYHLRHWLTDAEATSPALTGMPDAVLTDSYLNAPMARDTGASGDPDDAFPIVLFSHGYASYPEQSSFLTEHLAQWGFVVAAPDHRSRDLATVLADPSDPDVSPSTDSDIDDLDNTVQYLHRQEGRPGSPLPTRLDFSKVGVLGHSSGGGTAVTMADSPAIRTYVALAPAPGTPPSTPKPGLIMDGSADAVVPPIDVRQLYQTLPSPKPLIVIKDTGHNVFDDICTVADNGKRLTDFLRHVTSANEGLQSWATNVPDGCYPPDVFPTTARPLIDQATTAQMRYGVGIDKHPVGLDRGLDNAFPGVRSTYAQKL
jgi:alpha-beta hydrolase superfamily lysophospholipase